MNELDLVVHSEAQIVWADMLHAIQMSRPYTTTKEMIERADEFTAAYKERFEHNAEPQSCVLALVKE